MWLRKLALQRCELELLRSHPKDQRGSVREIGLCDRVRPTLHFLELMRVVFGLLTCCSKWSFSLPFWGPRRERSGEPFGEDLGVDFRTRSETEMKRKLKAESLPKTVE